VSSGTRAASSAERTADEAYRTLRSTVKFAAGDQPITSVLVVDIDRTEPSGVASRLADAFARAGDSCALVETDQRLSSGNQLGFSDLVKGAPIERVVEKAGQSRLTVVPPGTIRDIDLLAGDSLTQAIDALKASHAHLILSCASLPQHADALALAPRVDATIMVVSAGKTRRPRAIDARDQLERVGARILGVVMIDAKRRLFW
jgi:Mrp family chromosome partitioning ATPase